MRPPKYNGSHAILNLETQLNRTTHLLKNLYNQVNGIRLNWAGQWAECWNCHKPFAFGGNWNRLSQTDLCPLCEVQKHLRENP